MVLERLISLRTAVRNPLAMMIVGGLVSLSCLVISFLVFNESVGVFTTFLITIAMTPFMVNLLRWEEEETEQEIAKRRDMNFLSRHKDVLMIYVAFFVGMILSLSLAYIALPSETVEQIFSDQINEINLIRGQFLSMGLFQRIVLNNISVLLISFLFSFLFGAGAIFILSWNASVLSTAIGLATKTIGGVHGFPLAVLVFFPHGSLEILAYFIGAIAGGIVSAAVARSHSKHFWDVVKDGLKLVAVAMVLLLIAGMIESVQL
jgi:uncharacterized membrane protein SpoIIM required for sporulation